MLYKQEVRLIKGQTDRVHVFRRFVSVEDCGDIRRGVGMGCHQLCFQLLDFCKLFFPLVKRSLTVLSVRCHLGFCKLSCYLSILHVVGGDTMPGARGTNMLLKHLAIFKSLNKCRAASASVGHGLSRGVA